VAIGAKGNETRSWPTKYRGEIFIHSALKMTREQRRIMETEPFYAALRPGGVYSHPELSCGKIIARTEVLDCVEMTKEMIKKMRETPGGVQELAFGDYAPGRFAWKLAEPQRLIVPVPIRGFQQIWTWRPDEYPKLAVK